jgi:hypothetical protein
MEHLGTGRGRNFTSGWCGEEQGKGDEFPRPNRPRRVGLRNGSLHEEVRLTCEVHEAPGPAWQRLRGGNGMGRFGEVGWAGSVVETSQLGGNNP